MQTYFITLVINLDLLYVEANRPNSLKVFSYITLFYIYAR